MKVLLIDDHPLILAALRVVIAGLGDHVEVVGVATAAEAQETLTSDSDFDLVLLDLQLSDRNGFELLTELRSTYPALPVVIVSASDRRSDVLRSIDMGAMGFIPKCTSNEALLEALRVVISGGIYVPAAIMGLRSPANPQHEAQRHMGGLSLKFDGTPLTGDRLVSMGFTRRQGEVLELLLQGQPNKLIARKLNLSVETVKDHVAAVLRRLNVNTRTQAVLAVSEMSNAGAGPSWRAPQQTQPPRFS